MILSDIEARRFAAKVEQGEGGCLVWTGCLNSRGYGCLGLRKQAWLAHRLVATVAFGEIPAHLTVDHLCFNKQCVNPSHLEVVTRGENTRRAAALQTHCKRGHPLSGDNVSVKVDGNGHSHRQCRECNRLYNRLEWINRAAA